MTALSAEQTLGWMQLTSAESPNQTDHTSV